MKNEKPILFRGEMVRAILDGRKTQTRRVIKPQPELRANGSVLWWKNDMLVPESTYRSPYGAPGDRLWVKETFSHEDGWYPDDAGHSWKNCRSPIGHDGLCTYVHYRASMSTKQIREYNDDPWPWTPSIFMPRWASRITLEVVSVRVERVQDISHRDAIAEGVAARVVPLSQNAFAHLWDSINAKRGYSWDSNPFVWVIEFRRITL